ncbi:hypothetical protein HD597_004167 [Nonomuraea thailandensis]|uniref:Uncharacterized protein n=1 Tax=Nonomuraea thailandensis TaxID=1188745 RepID=A0A9X2GGB2_9ACTN|nr:hypothetical protein [Nonomuraea thailandensis]MCP2357147.1 hypothetical protein [Nonomuraea thailandensis]
MITIQDESTPARRRRRLLRPAILAPAVGLAAAAAVAIPLAFGGTPAYAVAKNPDGTVSITINEAKNPKGLEAELRRMGYNIVVDYLPAGKKCATRPRGSHWLSKELAPLAVFPPTSEDFPGFQIDPAQIKPGQTGVLEFGVNDNPQPGGVIAAIWARVSDGPVGPCELVDGDAPLGDGEE